MSLSIESKHYGVTRDGQSVNQYWLRNSHGVEVGVINYGGIVTSFLVPDQTAGQVDIVLGYDSLAQYEHCQVYMGCIAGRFANRIANATFELDGRRFELEANNNEHHLHGGSDGFHKAVWAARVESAGELETGNSKKAAGSSRLVLDLISEDGHGGYPGALSVRVTYTLCDDNRLTIDYEATTDRATVVNLTSHGYFNLCGHQNAVKHGALEHELEIASTEFIPTSTDGIPLPSFQSVAGTPMDFTSPSRVGALLFADDAQLIAGSGYDHNWVLSGEQSTMCERLSFAARLSDKQSGRQLEVHTSQPGLQFYTANHVHQCQGKSKTMYGQHGSICLETQHYPDSPNRTDFPSTVLRPDEILQETTVYRILF